MKAIKRLLGATLLGVSLAVPSYAQDTPKLSGSIEQVIQQDIEQSYPRLKLSYKLPAEVEGFTFVEFYPNGQGYAGRTALSRVLKGRVSASVEMEHINEPFTHAALAISYKVPTPKKVTLNLGISPIAVNKYGKIVKDRLVVSYAGSVNLGKGFVLSGFGEYNLAQKAWIYGELELAKSIGRHFEISYNPSLLPTSSGAPHLEHRISLELKF